MTTSRKILNVFLSFVLAIGLCPTLSFATEPFGGEPVDIVTQIDDKPASELDHSSADGQGAQNTSDNGQAGVNDSDENTSEGVNNLKTDSPWN